MAINNNKERELMDMDPCTYLPSFWCVICFSLGIFTSFSFSSRWTWEREEILTCGPPSEIFWHLSGALCCLKNDYLESNCQLINGRCPRELNVRDIWLRIRNNYHSITLIKICCYLSPSPVLARSGSNRKFPVCRSIRHSPSLHIIYHARNIN